MYEAKYYKYEEVTFKSTLEINTMHEFQKMTNNLHFVEYNNVLVKKHFMRCKFDK